MQVVLYSQTHCNPECHNRKNDKTDQHNWNKNTHKKKKMVFTVFVPLQVYLLQNKSKADAKVVI